MIYRSIDLYLAFRESPPTRYILSLFLASPINARGINASYVLKFILSLLILDHPQGSLAKRLFLYRRSWKMARSACGERVLRRLPFYNALVEKSATSTRISMTMFNNRRRNNNRRTDIGSDIFFYAPLFLSVASRADAPR